MPELPDLEAIASFLRPRLPERSITAVETSLPWLVRTGADGVQSLVGHRLLDVQRRGKFLLFPSDDHRVLVVNPMLTGRFTWAEPGARATRGTVLMFTFEDQHTLRYRDARRMGRWYLVPVDAVESIPGIAELGPDALTVSEDEFVERLRRHPGQLKSTLTNQHFIAGIGNAYSDEVLWEAGLHPHRRRATLADEDLRRLYRSMRAVFDWAMPIVATEVAERLHQANEEWRAHLRIHRREGQPCPRCGQPILAQVRSGRETDYCLRCQPLLG